MAELRFAYAGSFKFPMVEKKGKLVADLGGKYGWGRIWTDADVNTDGNQQAVNVPYGNLLTRIRMALLLKGNLGGEENADTEVLFENYR